MTKLSPIRYLAITLRDGAKFMIRVSKETSSVVIGIEVDKDGDEVVPVGFDNRMRVVPRDAIKKAVEMRMNVVYGRLERLQ